MLTASRLVIVDDAHRARWNVYVDGHPYGHVFQRWEWGDVQAALGAQVVRLALLDDHQDPLGVVQVLVFDTGSRVFAVVPRGPVSDPVEPLATGALIEAAMMVSRGSGATLLRIEPQWAAGPESMGLFLIRKFAEAHQHIMPPRTILVDLSGGLDAVWRRFRSNTRNRIRLAEKRGVSVRAGRPDDVERFIALVTETQTRHGLRVGALDQYRHAAAQFGLGSSLQLLLAEHDGRVISGLMVFACGQTATYLWGASAGDEDARQVNPNQLLHWHAMQWAHTRGCTVYDLFGVPDEDETELERAYASRTDGWWSLYRFKRGFGGNVYRHAGTFDRVLEPKRTT